MPFDRPSPTNNALHASYTQDVSKKKRPLAVVHYSHEPASIAFIDDILHLTVPCHHGQLNEYWKPVVPASDELFHKENQITDRSGWCADGENFFAAYIIPDEPELALSSQHAYDFLINLSKKLGYTNIYRIWNYIGHINALNANGLERYRDFCIGRANAFDDLNYVPSALPAATGIGFQKGGVSIFLIARKTPHAVNIENSLQVPAYQYPQIYGPKSPSFARATVLETQVGRYLYVSGTASIRQHRSLTDSLEQQITMTIENIKHLIKTAQFDFNYSHEYICDSLKIYVRHEQDASFVASAFHAAFNVAPENAPVLISDICRSELSLEVEGIFKYSP